MPMQNEEMIGKMIWMLNQKHRKRYGFISSTNRHGDVVCTFLDDGETIMFNPTWNKGVWWDWADG